MKKFMALSCVLLLAIMTVSEAQAQRRRGGDDDWRRRGNRGGDNHRRGDARRDRGNDNRGPRGPVVDRDRRGPRGPVVDRRQPPRRDHRDNDRRDGDRWDNDRRGPRGPVVDRREPPRRDRDYRNDRDYRRDGRRYRDDNHRRFRHRPDWRNPSPRYRRHTHTPRRDRFDHRRRYSRRYDYHRTIPYRYVYWDNWIRYRVSYNDGFVIIDGYPYFVYNGYRHRYSSYDRCDFDLVDGWDNRVERTFYGYTCQQAYDLCADLRDDLNWRRSDYRYFCSERLDFSYGSYTHWDYNDDFYYDVY